jgi:GNAT superfamily N-acetyltransferase
LINSCGNDVADEIFSVINEAAKAYRGVIPLDLYHEPYMSMEELRKEMSEIVFLGYREEGKLLGVAGYQEVRDVTLVRHVYVLPDHQRRGRGNRLLAQILRIANTERVLVGTWEAATWAIRFYQKNGFKLQPNKAELLTKYWRIPSRQIELSVVLGT